MLFQRNKASPEKAANNLKQNRNSDANPNPGKI